MYSNDAYKELQRKKTTRDNEDMSSEPMDDRDDNTGMDFNEAEYNEDPNTNSPLAAIVNKWSSGPPNSMIPNNGARSKTHGKRTLTYGESPPPVTVPDTNLEARPPPPVEHKEPELPADTDVNDEISNSKDPLATNQRDDVQNQNFNANFPHLPQPRFHPKRGASSPANKEPLASRFRQNFSRNAKNFNKNLYRGKK